MTDLMEMKIGWMNTVTLWIMQKNAEKILENDTLHTQSKGLLMLNKDLLSIIRKPLMLNKDPLMLNKDLLMQLEKL